MIYTIGIKDMFNVYTESTIEEAVEYCKSRPVLGIDTETTGLDFLDDNVIMFQIGDEHNQYIIDTRVEDITPFKDILESRTILKILHNFKFDDKFLRVLGIFMENIWDTMIIEQVLTNGKGLKYGLLQLLETYYPEAALKVDKSTRLQFTTIGSRPFTSAQINYGAEDIKYLPGIVKKQQEKVTLLGLDKTKTLENDAVIAFSEIEYNGIAVDPRPWLKLADIAKQEAIGIGLELDDMVIEEEDLQSFVSTHIQGDLFMPVSELRKVDIKWTSPSQVLQVFRRYGLDIEGVGVKDVAKFSRDRLINKYLIYKKKMKLANSYGSKFLELVKSDGRIHTNFKQILNTGRVASSKPNMQQIPGTNAYRNCFVSGYDDWVYVSSDYSSQELAVIAFGSQDPVWLKALSEKKDLHSVCAELVYGSDWTDVAEEGCAYMINKSKCNCKAHKSLRTGVKTINFGLAYGMSEFKLADTLSIEVDAAVELIDKYFSSVPKIKNFLDKLGDYGVKNGYIMTYAPYRRRRWFPKWGPKMTFKEKGEIERASKNSPIQGASADMTKQAMIYIREEIRDNKWPVKMVMTVHDQIDTICHKDKAEEWKIKMTELMEKAALIIVTNGLLKSETEITNEWSK